MNKPTSKFKYCNHHHELDKDYELIDLGDGEFVANKDAILLLKALNAVGLKTRTHHYTIKDKFGFVGILLDNVNIEIRKVDERDSTRKKYNGKYELLINWKNE